MNKYSNTLRKIISQALPGLQAIAEEQFNNKPAPSKWSKKEILGHLIDSAYNNHQRFARAGEQENLIFNGYDQVAWVQKNQYQQRQKEEVINTWFAANQHLSFLIDTIPQDLLEKRTSIHNYHQIAMKRIPEGEPSSLSYLIEDYIFHLEHHLVQIITGYKPRLSIGQ